MSRKTRKNFLIGIVALAVVVPTKLAADTFYLDGHDSAGLFFRIIEIVAMVVYAETRYRIQNEFWDDYNKNKR